jgi:hypothetical protein
MYDIDGWYKKYYVEQHSLMPLSGCIFCCSVHNCVLSKRVNYTNLEVTLKMGAAYFLKMLIVIFYSLT